jgi:hypothetical protein
LGKELKIDWSLKDLLGVKIKFEEMELEHRIFAEAIAQGETE